MRKKLLAVLMTGAMVASFAGSATACLLYTSWDFRIINQKNIRGNPIQRIW